MSYVHWMWVNDERLRFPPRRSPLGLTAHISEAPHFLTLSHKVEDGTLTISPPPFGSLAQLLMDKGRQHEMDCLAEYRKQGRTIFEVQGRRSGESFAT